MGWKFSEDTPIYLQLIEALKTDIVSGKYRSGDRLPAVRDLAFEAGVNPNTVQRAYAELERQGLVQSERTSGRFVSIDDKKIEELRKDLSDTYIRDLFKKLNDLGMDDKTIRDVLSKWRDE
ncbi:MAG: GntR family transcriptional regulator [Erysipelotrichaceae bacterium]|nr:GntR family transcriptional regulator [Erysipelotrichaceae bacterium]MBR2534018.1 GntR family transcriptional regulator [Erysipelotrichaceae bacterium]